jgi:hypothetical protein
MLLRSSGGAGGRGGGGGGGRGRGEGGREEDDRKVFKLLETVTLPVISLMEVWGERMILQLFASCLCSLAEGYSKRSCMLLSFCSTGIMPSFALFRDVCSVQRRKSSSAA